jgi:DNA polymerase I
MQIMLRRGIMLHQGTFTAVIAPEPVIISALSGNPDIGRFLTLFLCGNYSCLFSRIARVSPAIEVRRPFTADQLLTAVREAGHTIVIIEHDPTLFDGAERLLPMVSSALRDAGREALVILYAPAMDRSFAALARQADRVVEIMPAGETEDGRPYQGSGSHRHDAVAAPAQKTLEAF